MPARPPLAKPAVRCAVLAAAALLAGAAAPQTPGRAQLMTFDEVGPLSSNDEIARRALSPLTADAIAARLAAARQALAGQPVDPAHERFIVRLPAARPASGYGLLIFVPPWGDGHMPADWGPVLDEAGLIFVSAQGSGNDQTVLGRREPLAVLGALGAMQRFAVQPGRVFVAGFSGGSRVALKLAVGWPDLFAGALMDADADPVGGPDFPLPPRQLFERLRTGSRLVFAEGSEDAAAVSMDAAAIQALRRRCVSLIWAEHAPWLSHEPLPPSILARALARLAAPPSPPTPTPESCWSRLTTEVDAALDSVGRQIDAHHTQAARAELLRIDRRFAGLAAPRSVDLAHRLDALSSAPGPAP